MIVPLDHLHKAFNAIQRSSTPASSVLIFVAPDCDSVAACRIFAQLLCQENIGHDIIPVGGYEDIHSAKARFVDNSEQLRSIVMINCGGTVDLVEFFFDGVPSTTVTIFIMDAHRPYDLSNVRDTNQCVYILDDSVDPDEYPSDVSTDDEEDEDQPGASLSSSDDEAEDADGPLRKKRRMEPSRRDLAEKRARRAVRLRNYYRSSSYGRSVAQLANEMASQLSKNSNDMLWLSIVGLTDQLIHDRISIDDYNSQVASLQQDVLHNNLPQHQPGGPEDDSLVSIKEHGHIDFSEEYHLMLLRHWSLYDALFYSSYVATRLGIWREPGRRRLHTFLIKMSLTRDECKYPYQHMRVQDKEHLHKKIRRVAPEFGLRELVYGSFSRRHDQYEVSAADIVHGVTALLESSSHLLKTHLHGLQQTALQDTEELDSLHANFFRGYDSLSTQSLSLLLAGFQMSKEIQTSIIDLGTSLIEKNSIVSTGPFRYAIIEECPQMELFHHPLALGRLSVFVADALREFYKKKTKPLVIAARNSKRMTYMVVGIPGTEKFQTPKNTFGTSFREAATKMNARIKHDGFETSVLEIQQDDCKKFIEILHSGLVSIE